MKQLLLVAVLFLAASPALAQVPSSLQHVDPKAPCFRWPAVDMDGDGVFDRVDHCINTPKGCTVDAYGCSIDTDGDGVCDGLDECANTPRGEKVNAHGCAAGQGTISKQEPAPKPVAPATPPPTPAAPAPEPSRAERELVEKGVLRLENVYFETNKATLLPESETSLNEAGKALEKYPMLSIEVQGHTDTRGTAASNLRLSQARAEAVRGYLVAYYHLDADHVVARGYGETAPAVTENSDEDRQNNRRVVLKVLNPDALPHGVEVKH